MEPFYDAHSHIIEEQIGGFLIALEGTPLFKNTFSNVEVIKIANKNNMIPVEYVTNEFKEISSEVIKIHPRREKYTVAKIIEFLKEHNPKIVIIDTLNLPFFDYKDYWQIIMQNNNINFVLAHCGGYEIDDFIKILDFNENVYTDFSLTQEYFGIVDGKNIYKKIEESMNYIIDNKKLSEKLLFGSDNPFFSQKKAYNYYLKRDMIKKLNNNFEKLINKSNL